MNATNAKGFQRVAWDLRYPASTVNPKPVKATKTSLPPATMDPWSCPDHIPFACSRKLAAPPLKCPNAEVRSSCRRTGEYECARSYCPARLSTQGCKSLSRGQRSHQSRQRNQEPTEGHQTRTAGNPTADPNLGQLVDQLDQRNNDLLRQLRGDVILAARNEMLRPPSTTACRTSWKANVSPC